MRFGLKRDIKPSYESCILILVRFNTKNEDQMFLLDMHPSVFEKRTVVYDMSEGRFMSGDDDVRPFPKSMSQILYGRAHKYRARPVGLILLVVTSPTFGVGDICVG